MYLLRGKPQQIYNDMSLLIFFFLLNTFSTGKVEKLDFWDFSNSKNFKHQQLENPNAKSITLDLIRKLIEYSLKKVLVKIVFTLTIFEILQLEGRSVL